MARQTRSEATRRKLLDAAIEVFGEVGCVGTARAAIIERAGVTKGALYHHFETMEALVAEIIGNGCGTVLAAFQSRCQPSTPAVEGMIQGMFAVVEAIDADREAMAAGHLLFTLPASSDIVASVRDDWQRVSGEAIQRGVAEGDLRSDIDPTLVVELLGGALLGVWLQSQAGRDYGIGRMARMWQVLLPTAAVADSLEYFREFLARETQRLLATPAG